MRDAIAQRQQEVIVGVVPRAEHRVGFLHQPLPLLREIVGNIDRVRGVADQIGLDGTRARCRAARREGIRPPMTGESTSVVSDTGAKSILSLLLLATGSAVANFHPAGSCMLARNITSSVRAPCGYSTTWFHE